MLASCSPLIIWAAVAVATVGLLFRPFRIPEYVWALSAAALLPLLGAVSLGTTWHAVAEGRDVYLFLIGMMVLAELARREGLFDWLALYAVRHAGGSGRRLFDLVFLVGTVVTVFLSNDATAVVLTPAVYAACKAAMISFTRSMALELSAHSIRVHALAPDMIETDGIRRWFDAEGESGKAARERYIPLGRTGTTEELAGVVAFLCSRLSAYTTGLTIPVDGGAIASSGWTRSPRDGSWGLYHG